jgi:hypothetical protein
MLNYYFGALGGDSLSRMALAYHHLYGRGVPKSCWTAASYYLPVAEEVGLLCVCAMQHRHVNDGSFVKVCCLVAAWGATTIAYRLVCVPK